MLGSLNAPDVDVDNRLWVEAFIFFAYSGRTWENTIYLQCLSFWWSCISCKHRLLYCQVCWEQPKGNRTGLSSVKNSAFTLKIDLKWKFKCTVNATNVDSYKFKLPATKLEINDKNKTCWTISFKPCLVFWVGTGVAGPPINTWKSMDVPLRWRLPPLIKSPSIG